MTATDHTPPRTWGRGGVAVDDRHFGIRVSMCRSIPHLRAAAGAEAARINHPTRPERIARINQRINDLQP